MNSDPAGPCPICHTETNRCGVSVKGYSYTPCERCKVLYLDPLPQQSELKQYYQQYRAVKAADGAGYLTPGHLRTYHDEKKLTFRDLGFDLKSLKSQRLLDVGCANGPFLALARDVGADILGIDICVDLVEEAQRNGLNCRVAAIDELSATFDVICLWDVIEHVPDPRRFLGHVRRLSRSGTDLFIQTPRYGRLAELLAESWRYLMPVEHVILYSLEGLTSLLEEFGFRRHGWISFGSGNNVGTISPPVKRAFDGLAKETGNGDTLALWAVREE